MFLASVLANVIIATISLAMPAVIAWLLGTKRQGISTREFWTVAAFLPASGLSRLAHAWDAPEYPATVAADVLAMGVVVYSAAHWPAFCWHVLQLPSRAELHTALALVGAQRAEAEAQMQAASLREEQLRDLLVACEQALDTEGWSDAKAKVLRDLHALLAAEPIDQEPEP